MSGKDHDRTDVLAPTQSALAGKYQLGRMVGEGGMGSVYEADHIELGAKVAVKLLGDGAVTDPKSLARFKREARAMGQVRHPNVVQVMDAGTDDTGMPYLVMELLDGESLSAILRRERSLKAPLACEIADQILSGLAAAHDKGVIHRDLKPGNVFITVDGDGVKRVRILDFGISKLNDSSTLNVTAEGALVGTPNFMAPEQITGEPELDARIDVYAVGVLFYRMLTGRLPYVAKEADGLYKKILTARPKRPRELKKDIPEELEAVVLKAMSPDRKRRYQSARELRDAIRQFALSHEISLVGASLNVSTFPQQASSSAAPTVAASPRVKRRRARGPWYAGAAMVLLAGLAAAFFYQDRLASKAGGEVGPALAGPPLYYGITRYLPKEQVETAHEPVVEYVARAIGRKIEITVVEDYQELVDKVIAGEIHLAALSAYSYVRAQRSNAELRLLATPVRTTGTATYRGHILTRADSGIKSLEGLKGKVFCYVREDSTSGYLYPRALLRKAGLDPDKSFKHTRFGGDHLATLRMLHRGACDGAAVYSSMLASDQHDMKPQEFHVLDSTDEIPYDAYVVSKGVDRLVADKIAEALLGLVPKTAKAQELFAQTPESELIGFVPVSDSDYDGVRSIESYLEEPAKPKRGEGKDPDDD